MRRDSTIQRSATRTRGTPARIVSRIRRALNDGGSAEHAAGVQWFFKEEIKSHGWYTADLRRAAVRLRREVRKEHGLDCLIEVADQLFSGPVLEEKVAAVFLLAKLDAEFGDREFKLFESWLDRISSWADHDGLVHDLIAPMVASKDPAIAAIVALDGPGTSGAELARYQIENAVTRDASIAPAAKEKEIQKQLAEELTPREKSVLSIDPIEYARKVGAPALIVHGGNDLHVPIRSAERLAYAMRSNGNKDVSVRIFPGISHSLLPDPIGLNSGWVYLPAFETSPEILETISAWMVSHLLNNNAESKSR